MNLKNATKLRSKKAVSKINLQGQLRRRPCLLGNKIGPLVQKYLKAIDKKEELWILWWQMQLKCTSKTMPISRERQHWNRKTLGSKPFPTSRFCLPHENHEEKAYSSWSSEGSRVKIVVSNRKLLKNTEFYVL